MQPKAQALGKFSHSPKPRLGRKNLIPMICLSASRLDLVLPSRYYIVTDVSSLIVSPIREEEPLTPYSGVFYV
jgi:hypothetical protein